MVCCAKGAILPRATSNITDSKNDEDGNDCNKYPKNRGSKNNIITVFWELTDFFMKRQNRKYKVYHIFLFVLSVKSDGVYGHRITWKSQLAHVWPEKKTSTSCQFF